jgi:hypothetical protein
MEVKSRGQLLGAEKIFSKVHSLNKVLAIGAL